MCGEQNQRATEFLQYAIGRLESRIALVDNKASILMAVVTALSGALFFLTRELLWDQGTNAWVRGASCVASALMLLWLLGVIFLLLRTLRPTESRFRSKTELSCWRHDFYSLLWPRPDFMKKKKFHESHKAKYGQALKALPETIREHCEQTHFALFQLMSRKYRHYRRAMLLLRLWVCLMPVLVAAGLVACWVLGDFKS